MSKKQMVIKLTEPEINHLLCLIYGNESEGVYNGPRLQYWARSMRIKTKLREAQDETQRDK